MMKLCMHASLAGVLAAFAAGTMAQTTVYPTKPVRFIVPYPPSGGTDTVARLIAQPLSERLKQQVVVDNRAGAAGNIGVEVAVKANPDGYTFLLGNVGTMAINPSYYTKFPYRPLKDLIPITQVVDVPGSLVVHPTLPVKSAKELATYIKANSGKLNYGSPAPSSANSLEMLMFLNSIGAKATEVPYKGGAGPATIGLLTNEVQIMFVTFSSALPHVKQDRMRMVGVIAPERNPALPDVPTMREQGFDMTVGSWQGIFVPKDTPRAVVAKLFEIGQATMQNAQVRKRLADGGVSVVVSKSSADFVKFVKDETERFGKVIRDANIQTQ